MTRAPRTPEELLTAILSNILVTPTGCWLWQGTRTPKGYGQIRRNGQMEYTHRVAYELFVGAVAEGFQVDHVCHNEDSECAGGSICQHRACINPDHLRTATSGENTVAGRRGDASRQPLCPSGLHEWPLYRHRAPYGHTRCLLCAREGARKRRERYRAEGHGDG